MLETIKNFLLRISFILISLQIIHLIWLTCNITLPLFNFHNLEFQEGTFLFVLIDYLELPSIFITLTNYAFLIYHRECKGMNIILVVFLLLQLIHILWITDKFVVDYLHTLPFLVVLFVVFVDYLELTVVWDLGKRVFRGKKD